MLISIASGRNSRKITLIFLCNWLRKNIHHRLAIIFLQPINWLSANCILAVLIFSRNKIHLVYTVLAATLWMSIQAYVKHVCLEPSGMARSARIAMD